jgi:hypothetical protein
MATLPTLDHFQDAPEVRPLPSTGITRLRRYYGPVRHPTRPGLVLADCRLLLPAPLGLPVLREWSCANVPASFYPGSTEGAGVCLPSACFRTVPWGPEGNKAFPVRLAGPRLRFAFSRPMGNEKSLVAGAEDNLPDTQRSLAFRPVGSPSPQGALFIPSFSQIVTSLTVEIATGCNTCIRVGLSPTEPSHLGTAHRRNRKRRAGEWKRGGGHPRRELSPCSVGRTPQITSWKIRIARVRALFMTAPRHRLRSRRGFPGRSAG